MDEQKRYFQLLAEKFPTMRSLSREIINLTAILNLPKGTEHFMSDLHGEYEAFYHILNNCSGVIREKVAMLFSASLCEEERKELCTLIYYPKEKLAHAGARRRRTQPRMVQAAAQPHDRACQGALLKIHPFQGAQGDARGL